MHKILKVIGPLLLLITSLIVSTQTAFAQVVPKGFPQGFPGQNMDMGNMQGMMQQMQKMGACMETINKNELEQLKVQGKQFSAQMKTLCAAGKRDEAQNKALAFGQNMIQKKVVQDLQRCTKMMAGAMKQFAPPNTFEDMLNDYKNKHVCDEIK